MLDANEALGRNSDAVGLKAAFRVPSGHTGVRNGVASQVGIQKSKVEISEESIREALSRILESSIFAQSRRLCRFLRFTIETTLAGEEETLKEYLIGTEVYERKPSYQPTEDAIVRSEAHRLRSKLKKYYESIGKGDPVFICYRAGSYAPVFRLRHSQNGNGIVKDAAPGELFVEGRGIRIAVLPFVDASSSNLSSACAPIITDELIHELVRTHGLRVTAVSSVVALPRDIPAIARKLDVQIVADGTVRQIQNHLHVISRVIDADGFQIWSEWFETEADPHGLFKLPEKIVSALVNSIRPRTVVDPKTERLSTGGDLRSLGRDDQQIKLAKASRLAIIAEHAASIAHELNQPLMSILVNAQAAKRWLTACPPNITEANKSIEWVIRDARAADETMRHIRALFKQEPVVKKEASLSDMVREVVRLVQKDPNKREIQIDWSLDENLPKIPVDHIPIQRVFINLISNAIEALENNRISPLIKVRAAVTDQNEMVIQVIDNGPGVNDPEKIFDAFVTTKEKGMGIGLTVSRSIVEAHGGRLWAENSPDGGARFKMALPLSPMNGESK